MSCLTKELKINVWEPYTVVNKILDIVLHGVGYIYERCGTLPTADQIINFGKSIALCMNMFDPDYNDAQRPRLKVDNVAFLFDNGINLHTNRDNYPCLYITGIPFDELKIFESSSIEVRFSREMVVVVFTGEEYRYGQGWAVISTIFPVHSITKELIDLHI